MAAVSMNPLLFLTENAKEIYDELARDADKDFNSYDVSTITNEEITILTEIVEEFWIYLEDEHSPEVLKYNIRLLGKKFENLEQDSKLNNWDDKKTKETFHNYEKEMKKIHKLVKKGVAENPGKEEYGALQDDVTELEKKCHHTRGLCVII